MGDAFQEMEWASMDGIDAEDFDLSNITDDENENESGTPVSWSDETDDWLYWHCW